MNLMLQAWSRRPCQVPQLVLLLLLLLLLLLYNSAAGQSLDPLQNGTAQQPDPLPELQPDFFGGRIINMCTSHYAPIVYCQDRDPSEYSGYDIALFERVRQQMGWPLARLNWSCIDWYEMLDRLASGDGSCDIAVAGVDISNSNLDTGISFSLPTYQGGYKIMVDVDPSSTDYFAFMDAFSWELWLALILTAIGVGGIIWAAERWAWLHKPSDLQQLPGLQQRVWTTLGRPMQTADITARNFSASLIILIFAFMSLILTTLYTANTAANLTATQLSNRIRSVADLPGKTVGTWEDLEYISDLARRNIQALGYPWDTDDDLLAMFEAVKKGELQAVVLDSYILDFYAASDCDLATVGSTWDQYDQAAAFRAGLDSEAPGLLKAYNKILTGLKESGDMEALVQQYITPEVQCKASGVVETSSQVSFKEVSGLWILLGISIGVALVVTLAGQLALHSARRVARTQAWQASASRVKSLGTRSLTRLRSLSAQRTTKRRDSASRRTADGSSCAELAVVVQEPQSGPQTQPSWPSCSNGSCYDSPALDQQQQQDQSRAAVRSAEQQKTQHQDQSELVRAMSGIMERMRRMERLLQERQRS